MFALRAAGLIGAAAVLVGCSSGSGNPTAAHSTSASTPTEEAAAQQYLDAVNQLCDDLLPKVVKATGGGSIDIPAKQYLQQWPAHRQLLAAFDHAFEAIRVPQSATKASQAMTTYIAYADRLDAARLAAAQQGEAAYRAEVKAEEKAPLDPSVEARTRAGFHQSCDAR